MNEAEHLLKQGLTSDEVNQNRQKFGNNLLTPPKKVSLWQLYLDKFKDPIIQILLVAAFLLSYHILYP